MVRGSLAADIRALRRKLPGHFADQADKASELIRDEVRDRTPVGTRIDQRTGAVLGPSGALRRSVRPLPTVRVAHDTWVCGAYSTKSYVEHVEYGTRAHIIEGNLYLRFWSNGNMVIRRRVNHPGMRGHHMFALGLAEAAAKWPVGADTRLQAFLTRTMT